MKTYKDTGIVFKQVNIGEADKILSILTKYHGRVDAVAKGVRKITSRKGGSVDLATLSQFAFAKGKNLDIVTEVELVNDYKTLKTNLNSTFKIFIICEIIDNFIKDGEKQKDIYDLVIRLFDLISINHSLLTLCSFELKLMLLSGFDPNLSTCLKCSKLLEETDRKYASKSDLGFLCPRDGLNHTPINNKLIKSLRYLRESDIEDSVKLLLDEKAFSQLHKMILGWLEIVIGKELKSKKYILNSK
ncbi:MAG: DNA repair protein RecO [Patescibacteria group bacterium]|nr:DNA repair protein RecO [Patescibacteria group bacterium]